MSWTIPHPLAAHARATPSRPALWTAAGAVTYSDLTARVARAAAAFEQSGVRPRQRVVLAAPADDAWLVSLLALGWLDAVPVLVDPQLAPALRVEMARMASAERVLDDVGWAAHGGSELRGWLPPREWQSGDEQIVLFTSASAGEPKCVALTAEQLVFAAMGSAVRLGLHLDDVWLCCLPPWHVGGVSVVMRAQMYGTGIAWCQPFDVARVDEAIDEWPVTQLSLVPIMLERLLAHRGGRRFPARLRWALVGGAGVAEDTLAAAEEMGLRVLPTWGMTESAAQLATLPPTEVRRAGIVGPPIPFASVRAGRAREDSEHEEHECLVATGPQVGGLLVSSDRGWLTGDGWVAVAGRVDRQIKSGGELVSPERTEEVLAAHPAVRRCTCFGVDSARWGTALAAWLEVECPPGSEAFEPMRTWVAARLPPAQRPRVWAYGRMPVEGLKVTAVERQRLMRRLEATRQQARHERGVTLRSPEAGELDEGVFVFDDGELDAICALHPELHPEAVRVVSEEQG